jgi:hypothetical protein
MLQIYVEIVCEFEILMCVNIFPQNERVEILAVLTVQFMSYVLENMITSMPFIS